MDNNLEIKLKELKKGYIKKLEDIILSFKILLSDKNINVDQLYQKVHTISGTSGMYGLRELSDISTEFEIYLKPINENLSLKNEEELKNKISDFIGYIERTVLIGE